MEIDRRIERMTRELEFFENLLLGALAVALVVVIALAALG
jgi:hypothetical protein